MKLLFNISFLLLSFSTYSRDIVLVTYKEFPEKAKLVETLLEREIHIPKNLIRLSKREIPCHAEKEASFHICIDASGEMIVLKRDEELAQEAFAIFSKEIDNED